MKFVFLPFCVVCLIFCPFIARSEEPLVQDNSDSDNVELELAGSELKVALELEESTEDLLPPEFLDTAFEHYVALDLVGTAISDRDAVLLTDIGLQLAEGERILLRTHKSGISASEVLLKATKLAAARQDKITLTRLNNAAKILKDQELALQVTALLKTSGVSRASDPALTIAIDSVNLDTAIQIKELLNTIEEAELLNDEKQLDKAEAILKGLDTIPDQQKSVLRKRIQASREMIKADANSSENPLAKLVGATRGFGIKNTPFDPGTWIPRPRPDEGSSLQVVTSPFIDQNGYVWSGTSSGGGGGSRIGRADLKYNNSGHAYWVSSYSNRFGSVSNSPKRAPQHDRKSEGKFHISTQGSVYLDGNQFATANRGRLKNGQQCWYFKIPNGWTLIRVDGESSTRKVQ